MTFQPRLLILESHQHIKTVFSGTTRPIELKFHVKIPYDRIAIIGTNCSGHMTKMPTTPIYGKIPLNILFSGTKRTMALDLLCSIGDVGPNVKVKFAS